MRTTARVAERAAALAAGPTRAIALTKRLFDEAGTNTLEQQLELEAELQTEAAATEDFREGVAAFVEKRAVEFRGSEQFEDLAVLGPALLHLFREDELAVGENVELRLGAFQGRSVEPVVVQLGRETRGPFVVPASDRAVVDLDGHEASLAAPAA